MGPVLTVSSASAFLMGQEGQVTGALEQLAKLHILPRWKKRIILIAVDSLMMWSALFLAMVLRGGGVFFEAPQKLWVLLVVMGLVTPLVVAAVRLDRVKLTAPEMISGLRVTMAAGCLALIAAVMMTLAGLDHAIAVAVIFGSLFVMFATGVRIAALHVLRWVIARTGSVDQKTIAIYGAGAAGMQLAAALLQACEARPAFFVDDNPKLQGMTICGLPVFGAGKLPMLIARHTVEQIVLAAPSMEPARRDALVRRLRAHGVEVQVLPSFGDMLMGREPPGEIRPVAPEQLLGRDRVALDTPQIAKAYAGRMIMVTGAGGSIGAELCRQLLDCRPAGIVLFDHSEFQLYQVHQELADLGEAAGIKLVARLGSVTDIARVREVIASDGAEIILHAAAYKHVPMVEDNPLAGAKNNVLGTRAVAKAAVAAGIERFILVSSDKAVRPANVMGATKRMAELVVQDLQTRHADTRCAMVRFGNVLGSSGSVLPLFHSQIAKGGPVTVTHPEVTRYFMTMPEAARLVLLAGAFAKGGEVFVLDMGAAQRVMDIARRMIRLAGRQEKDPVTGKGDIAIKITGLRSGEKLHEELLIDRGSLIQTPHPKILRAKEAMLSQIEVAGLLRQLERAIAEGDRALLRRIIKDRIEPMAPLRRIKPGTDPPRDSKTRLPV